MKLCNIVLKNYLKLIKYTNLKLQNRKNMKNMKYALLFI